MRPVDRPDIERLQRSIRSMVPGTLGGSLASASPIRRRQVVRHSRAFDEEPELEFPEPWAWYRSDDIAHYGDGGAVTNWPDRIGSRDLLEVVASGDHTPVFRPNRVDSHGALLAGASTQRRYIEASFSSHSFASGATVVVVQRDAVGDSLTNVVGVGFTTGLEITTGPASSDWWTHWHAPSGSGVLIIEGGIDGANWHAFLGISGPGSPGTIRLWVDGNEPTPDGGAFPRNDWSAVDVEWNLLQPLSTTGTEIAEWIIWDRVLVEGERDLVHAYLASRYPSLF